MDDVYELPPPTTGAQPGIEDNENGESSGEEDTPDWTKLSSTMGIARPVIPRRGEKEFEPAPGSGLQEYSLARSREAMVNALQGVRGMSSKSITYGLWCPGLARAQVFQARGIHFNTMGHSMRRLVPYLPSEKPRIISFLELLPEEALYLVERGSLMCYKSETGNEGQQTAFSPDSGSHAAPMTVQQAFAEMIGREDLTLERYECYAYLKRLGFIVTRSVAPPNTPSFPLPPPHKLAGEQNTPILKRIYIWLRSIVIAPFLHILRLNPSYGFSPLWRIKSGWLSTCTYPTIFRTLRIIPAGHAELLRTVNNAHASTPYQVFYHIWKPNTTWKKTAPPPPDFELVVIDARTTPIPSIEELTALFGTLPRIPPPLPRRRNTPELSPPPSLPPPPSLFRSIFSFAWLSAKQRKPPALTPHPFAAIRAGHKNVIIGVVDAGTVGFFRFGEGCFHEWPMI